MNKRIIIFDGDSFCGGPTALYLSNHGYESIIVDNLIRRNIDNKLEAYSLTPIQSMGTRLQTWKEKTGKEIKFHNIDVATNYFRLLKPLEEVKPLAVVHVAEQQAAPYSMKSSHQKRRAVNNTLRGTHNILCALWNQVLISILFILVLWLYMVWDSRDDDPGGVSKVGLVPRGVRV